MSHVEYEDTSRIVLYNIAKAYDLERYETKPPGRLPLVISLLRLVRCPPVC